MMAQDFYARHSTYEQMSKRDGDEEEGCQKFHAGFRRGAGREPSRVPFIKAGAPGAL